MEQHLFSMRTQHYHLFETALGACGIAWSDRGVTRFSLPQADRTATERRLVGRTGGGVRDDCPPPPIADAIARVQRYFAGERVEFTTVAVDLDGADPFDRPIYAALHWIGWGETATYGELAQRAGIPGEAYAVGQAMARNRIPLIVPCHRVLASGGKVGGFSAPGGTDTKLRMLALEGVAPGNATPLLPGLLTG